MKKVYYVILVFFLISTKSQTMFRTLTRHIHMSKSIARLYSTKKQLDRAVRKKIRKDIKNKKDSIALCMNELKSDVNILFKVSKYGVTFCEAWVQDEDRKYVDANRKNIDALAADLALLHLLEPTIRIMHDKLTLGSIIKERDAIIHNTSTLHSATQEELRAKREEYFSGRD